MGKKKKSKKSHDFIIIVDMYNDCEVAVFHSKKKYKKWFAERELKPGNINYCNAQACTVSDPGGLKWFLMYLPEKADQHTVAHECLHMAWYILCHHGIDVYSDNHEALAYLMAYLMRMYYENTKEES